MTYIFFAQISATAVAACTAAFMAVSLYIALPAKWLCEYGEEAGPQHKKANRCRRKHLSRFAIMMYLFVMIFPMAGACLADYGAAGAVDNVNTIFAERHSRSVILQSISEERPQPGEVTEYEADLKAERLDHPALWICAGPAAVRLLYFVMISVLLAAAALSDIDYCIIPDQLSAGVAALAALYAAVCGSPAGAASGAAGAACLILLSALLGRIVSGQEAFGMGDVKLMAACGAAAGSPGGDWMTASAVFFSASVISSAVWFALLLIFRKSEPGASHPMAPWIAASAAAVLSAELT